MTEALVPVKKGRKPVKIDWAQVEEYASKLYTRKQIAIAIGVSLSVLEHGDNLVMFRESLDKGLERCATAIHAKQYALAMAGNVKMLEILGKEFLGQRDGIDIRSRNETVIVHIEGDDCFV